MKAALYCRVSTTDQNCEMQLRELREYCQRRGWEIEGEYVDTGWSGAKKSRPELDRLMNRARLHHFGAVLVWKIDRFGRSVKHLSELLTDLDGHKIQFFSITQPIEIGDSPAMGRFIIHMLAAVAEFERELIRERIMAGTRAAIAAGKKIGRPKRIFRRDEVERMRREGYSWGQISKELGIPKGTARGYAHTVLADRLSYRSEQRAKREKTTDAHFTLNVHSTEAA